MSIPHPDDDPPVQCWHYEPGTPCDWNICRQPERLAAGDRGTDPAETGINYSERFRALQGQSDHCRPGRCMGLTCCSYECSQSQCPSAPASKEPAP